MPSYPDRYVLLGIGPGCAKRCMDVHDRNGLLCKALATLETEEEYFKLLDDLLTPEEFEYITNRLSVLLLLQGGMKQREIARSTGVEIATVSRASRNLKNGAEGVTLVSQRLQIP